MRPQPTNFDRLGFYFPRPQPRDKQGYSYHNVAQDDRLKQLQWGPKQGDCATVLDNAGFNRKDRKA